jgi:hypothetical protein
MELRVARGLSVNGTPAQVQLALLALVNEVLRVHLGIHRISLPRVLGKWKLVATAALALGKRASGRHVLTFVEMVQCFAQSIARAVMFQIALEFNRRPQRVAEVRRIVSGLLVCGRLAIHPVEQVIKHEASLVRQDTIRIAPPRNQPTSKLATTHPRALGNSVNGATAALSVAQDFKAVR